MSRAQERFVADLTELERGLDYGQGKTMLAHVERLETLRTKCLALLIDLNAGYDNAETNRQTLLLIEELDDD